MGIMFYFSLFEVGVELGVYNDANLSHVDIKRDIDRTTV
jgi:hypothetical protein